MNVLFLNPPFLSRFSREQRSPAVTKSGTYYYPKWLSYAAGVAIQNKHNVDLVDAPVSGDSVKSIIDRIINKNISAIVVDTSTPSILNDCNVVNEIKNAIPKINIMMVGRHVSAEPKETLDLASGADCIALREYEYTVRDWLEVINCGESLESLDGIAFKKNNEIIKTNSRAAIENLDELPFVSEVYKRFLNINDYYYGHSLHPLVVFDTTRGCPYHCSYCVYPQTFSGHKLRYRSVGNVADEFDFVKHEMPNVKTIMLEDDTFIVNKKRTEELADELIRRNNKIPYDSNCRADIGADVNFLKKLHKSGARLFCVGFESADMEVVKGMQKNNSNKQDDKYHSEAKKFVDSCKDAGIMVHGCFMVGNLNETPESMNKTLDWAIKLKPDTAQFFPIMVYPGTKAYDDAKEKGYIKVVNYDDYLTEKGLHNSIVNLPKLTNKELVEFCDKARRKFYLNPSYIFYKIIQSLKNPYELKRNFMGFAVLVKHLIYGSFTKTEKE
jgi:anaerobic magnesium-protoporphyrin IX monomethyl ester cyclase